MIILRQREFNSKAQKARRLKSDIEKAKHLFTNPEEVGEESLKRWGRKQGTTPQGVPFDRGSSNINEFINHKAHVKKALKESGLDPWGGKRLLRKRR